MTDEEMEALYEDHIASHVYEEPEGPPFGDDRQVDLGNACVGCHVMFTQTERIFPLFSGRANSARGTDKRARCQPCAVTAHVVDALKASQARVA